MVAPFSLLFAGALDLFFAPVIEFGPLSAWKALFGDDLRDMQTVFSALRDRIERHCIPEDLESVALQPTLRRPFLLTVRAACLRARRPL